MTKSFFSIFLLGLVVILGFWGLSDSFFSQDEWLGFGFINAADLKYVFLNANSPISVLLGTGRLFSGFVFYFIYKIFGMNFTPFAILQISLHLLNSVIVFLLIRHWLENKIAALLGASFFTINSVSSSAVLWPAAAIGTLPATTLILLSIYFLLKYVDTSKPALLFVSIVFLYFSFHFKEIGIFMLFFIPVAMLLFKHQELKKYKKYLLTIGIIIVIVIGLRLFQLVNMTGDTALFLTKNSKFIFDSFFVRTVLYPITSFSLLFVPPRMMLDLARHITNVYYPFFPPEQFILIAQTVVIDLLAILLTGSIFLFIWFLARNENKNIKNYLIFWIGFILMSFLPYIVISKSYSYLESRYYYLSAVGGAALIAYVVFALTRNKNILITTIITFLTVSFLAMHFVQLRVDVKNEVAIGTERKQFLRQLNYLYPTLSDNKNIFISSGNEDYYIPGNKLPFQQGIGYTLMTLYYSSGKIPHELITDKFLFEIGSQGYKEINGKGFGYYSSLDLYREEIGNENSKEKNIIFLNYDAVKKKLK